MEHPGRFYCSEIKNPTLSRKSARRVGRLYFSHISFNDIMKLDYRGTIQLAA